MTQTTNFDIEALPVRIDYVAEVPSPWDVTKKTNSDQWRIVGVEAWLLQEAEFIQGGVDQGCNLVCNVLQFRVLREIA